MEYRNKKTGAVIDVPAEMSGDWEAVKKAAPKKPAQKPKKEDKTEK